MTDRCPAKKTSYHQARWNERIIFELGSPGERGILPPELEPDLWPAAKKALEDIPAHMRRSTPPALPEISQVTVLRHYLRLSQENLGAG